MGTEQVSEMGGKRDIYYQKDLSKSAKENPSAKDDKGAIWTMLHDRNKDGISDAYQKKSQATKHHKAPDIITAKDRERLERQEDRMLDKKERQLEREINQQERQDEREANKAERQERADARKLDRETYKRKLILDEVGVPQWLVHTVAGGLAATAGVMIMDNMAKEASKYREIDPRKEEQIGNKAVTVGGSLWMAGAIGFVGGLEQIKNYYEGGKTAKYYLPIVPKVIKVPRDGSSVKRPGE